MVDLKSKLREEFNMHSGTIIRSFHRFASTTIPIDEVNGANFDDVYVRIRRYASQMPKSETNNVYTTIPGNLNDAPTPQERKRIIRFVTTTFADKPSPKEDYPETLKLVLAIQALVARGENIPDCFLVPIGEGGDGKSFFFDHLSRAIWGSGHSNLSSRNLQVDREWQQQGEKHIEKRWLNFDECNKERGLDEEVVKNLAASGEQPLRKNHQAHSLRAGRRPRLLGA